MRYVRRTVFVLVFTLFATAASAGRQQHGPVILCYHIVGSTDHGIHSISRETFLEQMRYLNEHGYRVISLSELYERMSRGGELPLNTVVVTVDDGWRSTMTEVLPIMRRFGFPFTAFIYPRFVAGGGSEVAGSLSWDEIRTLVNEGVDVQSHTYSHAFLTRARQRSRSATDYAKWLWRELAGSREAIEKQIGRPVRFLAYPYGDYDTRVAQAAAAAGYAAAVTCNHGPIQIGDDVYRLRRYAIDRTTTLEAFKRYVANAGKPVVRKRAEKITLRRPKPKSDAVPLAVTASAYGFTAARAETLAKYPVDSERRHSSAATSARVDAIMPNRREIAIVVEESEET